MTLRGRSARLALLLALGACTEEVLAPGTCPNYCPGATIETADTILTDVIARDSAFSGYLQAYQGEAIPVAEVPGVDSRAIFEINAMLTRVANHLPDTTTVPITVDSARLQLNIVRRDTNATNLWIKLYRLPLGLDSTTTFAALTPWFADSIVDSVNLSALLALPEITDSATGDTIRTDSAGHVLQVAADSSLILFFDFDTAQARFLVPESGKVAYGVRVAGDSLASIALGSMESPGRDARVVWFFSYPDTLGVPHDSTAQRFSAFDSFVFTPATPGLDSNLAVGGVPTARSLLRVTIPEFLRDSANVVRATLMLVPTGPVPGAPGDSFQVVARPVLTDLGAKSPLFVTSAFSGSATVHLNSTAPVEMELTNLVRAWASDTSATTTLVLGQVPEAAAYTQIRFYSSRAPAFRPALRVTYVRRFAFGTP